MMDVIFSPNLFFANAAEALADWLIHWSEQFGSARLKTVLFSGVTFADLLASAIVIAFVLVLNALLVGVFRRKAAVADDAPKERVWRRRIFEAVGKPVYLLLWVYGIYLALTPLAAPVAVGETSPLRVLLDRLLQVGLFVCVFWLFYRLTHLLEQFLLAWTGRSKSKLDDVLVPLVGKTLRVILPVIAIILALPLIQLPAAYSGILSKVSSLLIIAAVAFVLFQSVAAFERWLLARYDIKQVDNLRARSVHTQVHVLSKAVHVLISIFTIASILMLFEEVRRLGTSILASAGVVGIIIGFAAQRTIANLFAGFQLAMTQPIRIDDVVIVENEWGRVEEITLTYVVVRIWDQRRLIVPLSYFIEKPFQNWTRVSSELLGAVFLYVDYTVPLDEIRQEAKRIIENSPHWDRKFWNLQVTDATERCMQVRILATGADSGKTFDLRCEIREKLLTLIQKQYAGALPKVRTELVGRDLFPAALELQSPQKG